LKSLLSMPFVISITVGGVEKVPYARYCAVPCRLPSVIEPGTIVIDSRGSAAAEAVTVIVALDVSTVPSGFVSLAVTTVEPGLTPATVPADVAGEVVTVAIVGMLELQVT
jgi:hypothetical protein